MKDMGSEIYQRYSLGSDLCVCYSVSTFNLSNEIVPLCKESDT